MKYVLLMALLLFGCGSSGSDSGTPASAPEKNLFSSWAEVQPANGMVFDASNLGFGEDAIAFTLKAGGACACSLSIGGTQSAGNMDLWGCIFGAMGTANTDPGCAALNGNVTYTNSGAQLTLCRVGAATCSTWQ